MSKWKKQINLVWVKQNLFSIDKGVRGLENNECLIVEQVFYINGFSLNELRFIFFLTKLQ